MFSSVASALTTCPSAGAATAVGPAAYSMMVLIVQAASLAVSGVPSDHVPPGLRLNVQSLPSGEVSQDEAQSPSMTRPSSPVAY